MWILSSIEDESCFNLLCDCPSNVSRSGPGEILLHEKSVSTVHASFSLIYQDRHLNCPEILPKVVLCDLKSSNGTYISSQPNDFKKLAANNPVTLKEGDLIKFGIRKIFRLKYQPFIVTSSQIKSKKVVEEIKACIKCLGGHLVKEWVPNCSLLVMNELMVTAKTVCALAAGANIVTPAYLIDLKTAYKEKRPLPDSKDYLPVLEEPSLRTKEVSFYPNLSRRKLFCGKNFFFQNEALLKKMKHAVLEAGGTPVLLSENNYEEIISDNNILIKPIVEKDDRPGYVSSCYKLLKDNGLHPIPEADIGFAVVYNSIEKYCNPKFRMSGILQPNSNQSQLSSMKMHIYATETQNETESVPITPPSRTTIPESVRSSARSSGSSSLKPKEPECKIDVEKIDVGGMNKENLGGIKRSFADSISPDEKISESKSKKSNLSKTLPDPMEIVIDDEVDNTIQFQPSQCSTQKTSPDLCKKRKSDDFAIPEFTARKNVRVATPPKTVTESYPDSLDISCNSKSIPFDPYTLPSINVANIEEEEPSAVEENEDDKETQIFSGVVKDVKKEPVSQEQIEETPQIQIQQIKETPESQPQQIKKTSKIIVLDDDWIETSPSKPQPAIHKETKQVESSSDCFLKPYPVPAVNKTHAKLESEFSLTFSGKKRKGRLFSSSTEAKPEPYSVNKRPRTEQESMSNEFKQSPARTIKKSPSVVETEMNHNGRESPPLKPVSPDVEETPFLSTQKIKKEINSNKDVSELTETLEHSLMIVVVADNLIVKKTEPEKSFTTEGSNGLPNFKAFVKVWPNTTNEVSLPRIIGGSDLVASADESLRRESFVSSQPRLPDHLMRRQQEAEEFRQQLGRVGGERYINNRIGPNRTIDSDFSLQTRTGRRKGRL